MRRASWTVIGLTPALSHRVCQERWRLRGSIGCAVAGGEDEVGFVPRLAGGCSRLVALPAPQFQGREADVGQGEGGVGCLGLGVALQELSAYALELAADGQLSGVEVDVLPCQSQRFALAEAGDEDQGVGGVERVVVCPRGLQELPCLVARPGPTPTAADRGEGDRHCRVLGDQVFGLGVGEGGP